MKSARQSCGGFWARHFALWFVICLSLVATAADWPQFRGANLDGTSTDRIQKQWTGSVTNPVWRRAVSNCIGSLAVTSGRVFTQSRRLTNGTDMEIAVALDAANGAELWATPVDIASYPNVGVGFDDGPRSTPAVDGDSVFVLTTYLKLFRLNVTNGAVIWQKDLIDEFDGEVIPWQNAASPRIEDGLIYVNANCGTLTLMALRTSDGSVAWRAENYGMTHSTPTLATIHGVRQVIFATQNGLVSLNPLTGARLWQHSYAFNYFTSLGISPVVHQDMVFIAGAHSYGMGAMVAQVSFSNSVWSVARLWATNNPSAHWMTPVARDGFLYGPFGIQQFDSPNAQLKCIEMRTGAVKWSTNGFGRGATLLVDDHLVTITERGQLVLARAVTNAYTELGRFTAIPNYADHTNKCWNMPAVSDGRVFVRSTYFVTSFDLSLPALTLDAPQFVAPDAVHLAIRTVNGAPVASNRLSGMEVRATSDPTLSLTQWSRLTNVLVLTNGAVRVQNVGTTTETQRFFTVSEPR